MATFVPIPYNYVPTAPRSRSTTTRSKPAGLRPASTQSRLLTEDSRGKPMGVTLDALRPLVDAAAGENGSGMTRDQVNSSFAYSGNNSESDGDYYFPTIEELLQAKLEKEGFGVGGPDKEHMISGAVEESLGRAGSVDHSTSALSDSSSGHQCNSIVLEDDKSSASKDEINCGSLRRGSEDKDQGSIGSIEALSNSNIPTPPSDPYSILDSMLLSSEPLHVHISTQDPFTACSEFDPTKPLLQHDHSQSPRWPRLSQQNLLSQEVLAYPRQAKPALDNNTISEEKLLQQQDEEENINSNYDRLRPSNEITAMVTPMTEMGDELHLSTSVIRRTSVAKRHRILPTRSQSLEPSEE
ncbi:hypothetical protein VC83_05589 [Pseudogymnoascus destructans]|uniref:Uncharacterized protein n=1 Tax=Pseudogymnoascus destructans TaxID=655981 RepID=A0A177A6E3_9PEZI|nr:uncharacterized protein VC83_05589 [Pseudogymnoascus destructans]OAF57736.1 hypothetical protein VC83_05589 [Pseudogymnoascus destructans]